MFVQLDDLYRFMIINNNITVHVKCFHRVLSYLLKKSSHLISRKLYSHILISCLFSRKFYSHTKN